MCSNTEAGAGGGAPYGGALAVLGKEATGGGGGGSAAGALDHYRMQLYNYAVAERLRLAYPPPACYPPYPPRLALSMSLFHHRALALQPEEPKPQHSYIGLIAMAILSSPDCKLVLSDIYQHILDNYPYFRSRGPGWRNSIRHNLSLNDCFVKAGRSANGKGHYWAIHPANVDDFRKGDFRRRKAQRKVRKHMGLAVDDEGADSPSPPPLSPPPPLPALPFAAWSGAAAAAVAFTPTAAGGGGGPRKRQFDVASLLAPDEAAPERGGGRRRECSSEEEQEEDIDVVASDREGSPRLASPAAQYAHPHPLPLLSQWSVFPGGVFGGVEPGLLGRYYEQLAAGRRRPPLRPLSPPPCASPHAACDRAPDTDRHRPAV